MANDPLTQDFDAHALFTFVEIPDAPPLANRIARTKRWFVIAFAESWLAIWLYRAKLRLRAGGVPFLPGLCDAISRALFNVSIGDRVAAGPGLMITHGNVVIDGQTTIGRNCEINPWVTIGLTNSKRLGFTVEGPTIGDYVSIGTGAKVLGPVSVGDHVRIGANAVVVSDVPPNTTVVGAPARPIGAMLTPAEAAGDGPDRERRLSEYMHQAIVSFRLRRQSLATMTHTLHESLAIAPAPLRERAAAIDDALRLLDTEAAAGRNDHTAEVIAAAERIDAALRNGTS